jgi:anti-anti-sigma factor
MTSATVQASADHGTVHIRLSGEIDRDNASTVDEQICTAVSGQPTVVSVDLTNLTYMDVSSRKSCGLGRRWAGAPRGVTRWAGFVICGV